MGTGAVLFEGTDLSEADYVVLDVETTGFSAQRGDRVVGIAMLRCRPGEGVVDRFATLVNPGRAIGPTQVHRLTERHVSHAPTFAKLIPRLRRQISGAVVVAHNARFDVAFLDAEFARAGSRLPPTLTLCTIELAESLGIDLPDKTLAGCCRELGVPIEERRMHGASTDAQATAGVLLRLLRTARLNGISNLAGLGCVRSSLAARRTRRHRLVPDRP